MTKKALLGIFILFGVYMLATTTYDRFENPEKTETELFLNAIGVIK